MYKIFSLKLIMVLLTFSYPAARAQETINDISVEDLISLLNNTSVIEKTLNGIFKDALSIETINKIWKSNIVKDNRFLKDLNLEFKSFKVKDSDYGYGIGYSYDKDLARRRVESNSQMGIAFSLSFSGNIAFEKNLNPEDFLVSGLSFHIYKSIGGTIESNAEVREKLNELELSLAMIEVSSELGESPLLNEFLTISKKYIRDQFYFDFSLDALYESNQDFTIKQYLFGASVGFDYKLWKNEFYNIFDYPFAAIRWLSGYDNEINPLGASFPTLIISFESVDPVSYQLRKDLKTTDTYFRLSGEVSFKTPVSDHSFFEANLRYFKELNAADQVKAAGLDESVYFNASITTFDKIFFSYSRGRLPFDPVNDDLYQLGFRYNF